MVTINAPDVGYGWLAAGRRAGRHLSMRERASPLVTTEGRMAWCFTDPARPTTESVATTRPSPSIIRAATDSGGVGELAADDRRDRSPAGGDLVAQLGRIDHRPLGVPPKRPTQNLVDELLIGRAPFACSFNGQGIPAARSCPQHEHRQFPDAL